MRKIRKVLLETKNPRAAITRKNMEEVKRVRTHKFVKKVQQMMDKNPAMLFVSMANELKCSVNTTRSWILEDLRCRSYQMQTGHMLDEKVKDRRLLKSIRLLNKLKHTKEPNMIWFFSDEKNFCQDKMHNRQNNHWIRTCLA